MNAQTRLRLLVLAVLERQPEHGYAIAQAIKARSQGLLTAREGTLYPLLHALEQSGHLSSEDAQTGGRTRREYRLTEQGLQELRRLRGDWDQQVHAIGAVLGGQR